MAISFTTAKPVQVAKPKKNEPQRVEIADMEKLAALDSVIKSLTALKTTFEADVKAAMANRFVTDGCAKKGRPENFRGIEGVAEASCELRARSSASSLSNDEQTLLSRNSIPMTKIESVAETFVVNPAYAGDSELLGKVAAKLNSIKGIPEDFIQTQAGVSRTVIAEGAMDAIFQHGTMNAHELLSIVATLAIKPKMNEDGAAYRIVREMLEPTAVITSIVPKRTMKKAA